MATPEQLVALREIYAEARESDHIWPAMAACEAMEETAWLTEELGRDYRNLFGEKQSVDSPIYETVNLPTWEVLNNHKFNVRANFVWFPSYAASFSARMDTLRRLKSMYPNYAAALGASTPEGFVTYVSRTWSTDPSRATNCIAIFHAHQDIFAQLE